MVAQPVEVEKPLAVKVKLPLTAFFAHRHENYYPMKPKLLLHIEGGAVLAVSCVIYQHLHGSWVRFALFFLVPDISMFFFFVNNRVGAVAYNLVHTYTTPILLSLVLWLSGQESYIWIALIWGAHIGLDRLIGAGLKYETGFKDTHLNRV